jgi:hypothetical protein
MGFSGSSTVTTPNAYKRFFVGWLPSAAVHDLPCPGGTCVETIQIRDLQMHSPSSLGAGQYMLVQLRRLANLGGNYYVSYRQGTTPGPDSALGASYRGVTVHYSLGDRRSFVVAYLDEGEAYSYGSQIQISVTSVDAILGVATVQISTTHPSMSPTSAPTAICEGAVDDELIDMISGQSPEHEWLEIGQTQAGDQQWITVHSSLTTFANASIFVSLPDMSSTGNFSLIARVRNVQMQAGRVSFQTKLYQANDSYCSKEWFTPSPVPPLAVSWLIAEGGAYQLSGKRMFVDKGPIVRYNEDVSNVNNRVQFWFPKGCSGFVNAECAFDTSSNTNTRCAITQLQTVVYDRILIPRAVTVALRFARFVLQPHNSDDLNYYVMTTPETLSYLAFEDGYSFVCAEGWTFETFAPVVVNTDLLSKTLQNQYSSEPGVFGMVGTATSLSDTTGLRTDHVTTYSVSLALQEDQCTDMETEHTATEKMFVLVIGWSATQPNNCIKCRGQLQPLVPTFAPSHLPTLTPTALPTAPSSEPSSHPTKAPTCLPTSTPTWVPTAKPSTTPTYKPTAIPTLSPTFVPSASPTEAPRPLLPQPHHPQQCRPQALRLNPPQSQHINPQQRPVCIQPTYLPQTQPPPRPPHPPVSQPFVPQ